MMRNLVVYLTLSILPFVLNAQTKYYGGEQGKKLDWVMYYLQDNYVDSLDYDEIAERAILEMLAQLDPYSKYQSKEEIQKQLREYDGYSNEGIGVNYYILGDTTLVTYVVPGAPADRAGVKLGDVIFSINGVPTFGSSYNEIDELIDEDEDGVIQVFLYRNKEVIQLDLEKENLPYYTIKAHYMIDEKTGYIKQSGFTLKTPGEFEVAMKELMDAGMENLILDLRGNRGGAMKTAIKMADHFLSGKKLVSYSDGFNKEREDFFTGEDGIFETGKLAVLIDRNSMSASELFSSAIQEWDRGIVIGETSFGKGLIQQSYKLNDSSAVRLTIGKYYSPTGRAVQKPQGSEVPWLRDQKDKIGNEGLTASLVIPDSLRWKTNSGRAILVDEGRVVPDVYTIKKYRKDTLFKALNKTKTPYQFAVWYAHNYREKILVQEDPMKVFNSFHINHEISKSLSDYVNEKIKEGKIKMEPLAPPLERYTIEKIKSWLGALVFDNNTYYNIFNTYDEVILRALESFDDGTYDNLGLKN